jgi:hypothetical protein
MSRVPRVSQLFRWIGIEEGLRNRGARRRVKLSLTLYSLKRSPARLGIVRMGSQDSFNKPTLGILVNQDAPSQLVEAGRHKRPVKATRRVKK